VNAPQTHQQPPQASVGACVTGAVAAFGLVMASLLVAVVVAGALQWVPAVPAALDAGFPVLGLVAGLALAGRVAVDVAGSGGVLAAAGAAAIVAALGLGLSRASEAHGDSVEPPWVGLAAVGVFLIVGGSAWLIRRRRVGRTSH
jgi:ammonia channel protein AmtB